jgi:peptidoglycan LD-endopeptidase LytH
VKARRRAEERLVRKPLVLVLSLFGLLLVDFPSLAVPEPLRTAWKAVGLLRQPAPDSLPVPVEGVQARRLADSWGAPRSGGRRHEGIDIFAERGRPVRSATEGVVLRMGENRLGGRTVWVLGPAWERHYYAHLDGYAELRAGQVVNPGDLLGFVGDSGNARGGPCHLHYGIYTAAGSKNPYPVLTSATAARRDGEKAPRTSASAQPSSGIGQRPLSVSTFRSALRPWFIAGTPP